MQNLLILCAEFGNVEIIS